MQSYYVWTIGCQMNKADSERLESALGQMGLSPGESARDSDVIVLNSCVVRESAERPRGRDADSPQAGQAARSR